jgi:hypothetical protein
MFHPLGVTESVLEVYELWAVLSLPLGQKNQSITKTQSSTKEIPKLENLRDTSCPLWLTWQIEPL